MNAAAAVLDRLRLEWRDAALQLAADVGHAVRAKARLPDGYWQAEHDARLKLQCAEAIAEMFEELP